MPHPYLILFPEDKEPHLKNIRKLIKEITANAASQDYHLAGGNDFGITGLVLSQATYTTLSGGTAWAPMLTPVHPTLTVAMTDTVRANHIQEYKDSKELYAVYIKGAKTLKQLGLQAIPERYLQEISQPVIGLGGRTTLEILNHLNTTYGTITEEHLKMNEVKLKEPWDPATPPKDLFVKIADIQAFVTKGKEPIPDQTVVRRLAAVFRASGVMDDACNDWDKKVQNNKNLWNLCSHMHTYNTRHMATNAAASTHGYGTANSVQEDAPMDQYNTIQLND